MTAPTSPPGPSLHMGTVEWLMVVGLSMLWGGSYLFIKIGVTALPPFTVVFVRVALAALTLHVVVRLAGLGMAVGWARWRQFFGMGVLNNLIPFSLLFWGQTQISAGLASILNAMTPLFGVLVAHVLTQDEKATGNRLAGVVAGVGGVAIMMGPDVLGGASTTLLAQIACLCAAFSYALSSIYGRRFKGLPPLVTATGQVTASSLMVLPVMLLVDQPWTLAMPAPGVIAALLGLALLSTALAYIVFFEILKRAGATNLNLVTLLIPPSAVLLGWLVLDEVLLPRHFAGMAIIAFALLLIDGRLFRRRG
jgi:drug/metabolite transporter (DMT)-like permease